MITSCQPRPHPHSAGIAAAIASSGITTNRPRAICWVVVAFSSSTSGLAIERAAGARAVAVSLGLMDASGVVDMLLLRVRPPGGSLVRLRNRSLRDRRLG